MPYEGHSAKLRWGQHQATLDGRLESVQRCSQGIRTAVLGFLFLHSILLRSKLHKKKLKVTEEKQVSKVSEVGMTCTCLRARVYVSVALQHTTQVEPWPVAQQQVSTCHTFVYIGQIQLGIQCPGSMQMNP